MTTERDNIKTNDGGHVTSIKACSIHRSVGSLVAVVFEIKRASDRQHVSFETHQIYPLLLTILVPINIVHPTLARALSFFIRRSKWKT